MLSTRQVIQLLERDGVAYQMIPHERTETARDEARTLGVSPEEVAKTVVLVNGHGYIRAVVPAWAQVDLDKVQRLLGIEHELRLATETELLTAYPGFELGAVPPIGGPADRTVVDQQLTRHGTVVLEAGSHEESLRLRTRDLLVEAIAEIGDICAN